MRQSTIGLFLISITATTLLLFTVLAGAGAAQELVPGIDLSDARDIMRERTGNRDGDFLETICAIPLGLDVYNGMAFYTLDTNVLMYKALDFPAVFVLDDRVLGYRETIATLDGFVALKQRFPTGRFFLHVFPNDKDTTRVFLAETDNLYVFTNPNHDLYIFDKQMRQEVLSQLRGSFCWHGKLFGPSLPTFMNEYLDCVVRDGPYSTQLLDQDLERCLAYCEQTPEAFYSPQCEPNCYQTRERAGALYE